METEKTDEIRDIVEKIKNIVNDSSSRDKLLAGNFTNKYAIPSGIKQIADNFRNREDLKECRESEEGQELNSYFRTLEEMDII